MPRLYYTSKAQTGGQDKKLRSYYE